MSTTTKRQSARKKASMPTAIPTVKPRRTMCECDGCRRNALHLDPVRTLTADERADDVHRIFADEQTIVSAHYGS